MYSDDAKRADLQWLKRADSESVLNGFVCGVAELCPKCWLIIGKNKWVDKKCDCGTKGSGTKALLEIHGLQDVAYKFGPNPTGYKVP